MKAAKALALASITTSALAYLVASIAAENLASASLISFSEYMKLRYALLPALAILTMLAAWFAADVLKPSIPYQPLAPLLLCLYLLALREKLLRIEKCSDAYIYIEAGVAYISGTSPLELNWEHPPLAKYIIGLASLISRSYWAYAAPGAAIALLLFLVVCKLGHRLTRNPRLAALLLAADPLYLVYASTPMPDVYAVSLACIAVLLAAGNKMRDALASGVAMGLALASKWTIAPVVVTILYLQRHLKKAVVMLATMTLAYTATYLPATTSIHLIAAHQLKMIEFMSSQHLGISCLDGFLAILGFYTVRIPPHEEPLHMLFKGHTLIQPPTSAPIALHLISWNPGNLVLYPLLPLALLAHRNREVLAYLLPQAAFLLFTPPYYTWYRLALAPPLALALADLLEKYQQKLAMVYLIQLFLALI